MMDSRIGVCRGSGVLSFPAFMGAMLNNVKSARSLAGSRLAGATAAAGALAESLAAGAAAGAAGVSDALAVRDTGANKVKSARSLAATAAGALGAAAGVAGAVGAALAVRDTAAAAAGRATICAPGDLRALLLADVCPARLRISSWAAESTRSRWIHGTR